MKKIAILIIAALAAVGAFFALSKMGSSPSATSQRIEVRESEIKESGATYDINATYPIFGVQQFDERIKEAVEMAVEELKDAAAPAPEGAYKNSLEVAYADEYVGDDFLSVKLIISQYTGGAHPMTITSGLNFDRTNGKIVELSDALTLTGLTVGQLSQKVTADLASRLGDAMFTEGANSNPENFSSFVVSKDYVTFIFQPYQVAAYAAGVQEVSIPRVK